VSGTPSTAKRLTPLLLETACSKEFQTISLSIVVFFKWVANQEAANAVRAVDGES
jgi:hypothetical protein